MTTHTWVLAAALGLALASTGCAKKDGSGPSSGDSASAVKEAVAAADAWLALVDAGKYADSHREASSLFRSQVPAAQWETQVGGVRKPLGALVKRSVKSSQYMTSVPGAPDGKYVVIQYETSYASKASAIETVTPMADTDGKWRVSGYYIK